MTEDLTPRQIVAALDLYIIGQRNAKRSVAVALRNRWRRQNAPIGMREEIMPNNILMIGPTGVGKTEIARRLARLARAPFVKVEATKFTEVGYVGRDVDSMVRDLADVAIKMVREEREAEVKDKAREMAVERVLDLLVPPPTIPPRPAQPLSFGMAGSSVPSYPPESVTEAETATYERTRAKFREKLLRGDLDDREVEVEVTDTGTPMMQVFGPMGMEEMGMNLQDLLGGLGRKRKKRRVRVAEARDLLASEEAAKLIDMDAVQREAIRRAEQSGIIFIDEIDKVASRSERGGPDVSREGVQRDLLPVVEGSTVTTKYGMVKTDHVLFIASGAFHIAKPSDLIPELQGRFPIRVELDSLSESDFYAILTQPKNALLKQYAALFASEGITLTFTDEAVREIARVAAQVNTEVENIGARRLHTVLTTLLEDLLFEAPEQLPAKALEIEASFVRERLSSVAGNRDMSHYIL